MRRTIVEYAAENAAKIPDKIALITPQKSLTYSELFRLARGWANYLTKSGTRKGDVIALRASQTVDYAVQYLGTSLARAVIAPMGKTLSDDALTEAANKISAAKIIYDEKNILDIAEQNFDSQSTINFPSLKDTADIIFTTGTTGASKGVERTQESITAIAENHMLGCEYKNDSVVIVVGPFNHTGAHTQLVASIMKGSSLYILDGTVNLKAFFEALDYPGRVACLLPPSALRVIFQLTGNKIGEYKNKIDFILTESSYLPESDKERLCELLPDSRLYNQYGASEASSMTCFDYNKYRGKIDCVGFPMKNSKVLIVDENHNEIKSSRENPGLVAFTGDTVMKGYVNDYELTQKTLINGIVYSNDLGYIDSDGFVYVIGRRDDVINIGGLKVAPTEVESEALKFERIADCVCIAVPDKISGNALKLLVVADNEVNITKLNSFLLDRLENYKVPKFYERVDKVARTFNGKINRKFYRK